MLVSFEENLKPQTPSVITLLVNWWHVPYENSLFTFILKTLELILKPCDLVSRVILTLSKVEVVYITAERVQGNDFRVPKDSSIFQGQVL